MESPLDFIKAANAKSKARRLETTGLLSAALASPAAGYSAQGKTDSGLTVMSGSSALPRAAGKWVNPIPGALRVTSPYGPRKHPIKGTSGMHTGEDFGAAAGTPVFAVSDGVVSRATSNGGAYGNQVILDLGGNLTGMYGHLQKYTVKSGQRVRKGQVIGYVGSTGLSTGPHLHFETKYKGQLVDPSKYL